MSTSTTDFPDYGRLYAMATGAVQARLIQTGLELELFDHLETPRTAEETADHLRTHPGNTAMYLDALACIGLLSKHNGLYLNRSEASLYLCSKSPVFMGGLIRLVTDMCVVPLQNLTGLVRIGPDPNPADAHFSSEDLWAESARVSAAWVKGGAGALMAGHLAALPEFPSFRTMLDLGGGHGVFAQAFVLAHPEMTAVVFDRPAATAVANEFVRKAGLENRVYTRSGDYLRDDIGQGYDLIWACATLNFTRHDLDRLIAKILGALNPGGVFIAFQDGLTHERTQPDMLLGHLATALTAGSTFYFDQGEIAASMLRCGFKSVHSRTVKTPMGDMDMDTARKA
ncbi:MAG: methyltransferase domain-containing protein [Deltaproteobacteria bacterium]|nr:methyltransferase domain-containing protein [Deltaproteobacteria bacterium]